MLDAVVDYLPSPLDVPPVEGTAVDDPKKSVRHASDSEPFSALVFKIMTDPFVGQLAFFRVYSGKLARANRSSTWPRAARSASAACCACTPTSARTSGDSGRRYLRRGWFEERQTGDTICDEASPIVLESIDFPDAGDSARGRAQDQGRSGKAGHGDQKLAQEDPTFRVSTDPETGQTILAGMGELHLEIIVDRMMREFGVGANVGKPQVAYRETIRKQMAEYDYTHKKQTGGAASTRAPSCAWSRCRARGFEFVNESTADRFRRNSSGH
jgi:elongation factor G